MRTDEATGAVVLGPGETLVPIPPRTVREAMSAVMEDVRSVGKDGRNTQQNYSFRGIDAVVNAAGPAFRKHGIVPTPRCTYLHRETVEVGQKRTLMALVTVQVTYRFVGPAGDYIEAVNVPGEAMDSGDKAVAKAMSVAYRIALLQTLAIPTDDPDPDEHSYERAAVQPDEVACSRCGEVVAGARTDKEPMRAHLVAAHDWVRQDDGTVIAPEKHDERPFDEVPA